MTNNKQ